MRKIRSVKLALLALLISPIAAHAIPNTYDEAISGDLDDSQNLLLGTGANIVNGTITWSWGGGLDDWDSFYFTVAAGDILDSFLISIDLDNVGSGSFNYTGWNLDGSLFEDVAIPSSDYSMFTLSMPLSSGTYHFYPSYYSGSLGMEDWRQASYTMTMNVTSVSEPSTLGLFGAALIGFGVVRLRKRVS